METLLYIYAESWRITNFLGHIASPKHSTVHFYSDAHDPAHNLLKSNCNNSLSNFYRLMPHMQNRILHKQNGSQRWFWISKCSFAYYFDFSKIHCILISLQRVFFYMLYIHTMLFLCSLFNFDTCALKCSFFK